MKRIGILAACFTAMLGATTAHADPPTADETQKAGAALTAQLLDPASAQFQITSFRRIGAAAVFCGNVNAKNQMGGYTGFHPFVIVGDLVTIYQDRAGTGNAFAEYQHLVCGN